MSLFNVVDIYSLKNVFRNKFLPLLQEYFFGDFGKIGLVLGAGFFEVSHSEDAHSKNIFAAFRDYDSSDFIDKPVYRFREIQNMSDDEFESALELLMNR